MKGSLVKRSAGSWSIVLELDRDPAGKRRQKWITVAGRKKQAEAELARLLHEVSSGAYVDPTRDTLATYLERWLATVKPNLAGKTYERYREVVEKHLTPALGSTVLSKLRPMQIQQCYSLALLSGRRPHPKREEDSTLEQPRGLSAQTVLHHHRILREALQQAVRWQLLGRNPADAVEPPKPERREMRALNPAEMAWLLEVARGTRFYVPLLLAISTGMRRGEFLAIQWPDVDLNTGMAAVNRSVEQTNEGIRFKSTKGRKGRSIILPPLTLEALREHRAQQEQRKRTLGPAYDQGLICSREDGSLWRPDTFSADFRALARKAGIKVRLHDLRHSHATQLLAQGVHPKIVSERLGHSTVAITLDLYSHVLPGMQDEAVQKFDTALRAAIGVREQKAGRA